MITLVITLKIRFPNLYRLSSKHNASVAEFKTQAQDEGGWNFCFRRNVRDCELEELMELLDCLNNVHLNPALVDTRLWLPDSSHIFSCKSAFNKLRETSISNVFSPFKVIWKSPIPHKIKVFAWLVALGKVNTCDVLQKKRPNCTLNPNWCIMCKRGEETVDHLFIHCSFGSRLWWKLLRIFGLYWVVPRSCYGLLSGHAGLIKGKERKIIFNQFLSATLWAIWGERNNRIFQDCVSSVDELWEKICFWVAIWLKNVKSFRFWSFSDLLRTLNEGL